MKTTISLRAVPKEKLPLRDPNVSKHFPHTHNQPLLKLQKKTGADHHFPLRVGVVFSGGQASGGHDVICGLYEALKTLNSKSTLLGFLGGPIGIIEKRYHEIKNNELAQYKNQGGFDLIGSGRDKIETKEQFEAAKRTVMDLNLDGLVIIGGDDSNTNAALLAEYFSNEGVACRIIGVPKTIDGDLKNQFIETSFGFDTASKTYSHTIGAIERDALSAAKYYFFVKLMGRSASHITLECALQTRPNMALIGEEIWEKKKTLRTVVNEIADVICRRAERNKNYGVILIPEGIVGFIPEIKDLIQELNQLLAKHSDSNVVSKLSKEAKSCFDTLPTSIQKQLLQERDPHGNVQVSKIESERLFISLVQEELRDRKDRGTYIGKFNSQPLFLGYEGRSCQPSLFDSKYCTKLGHVTAILIDQGCTGYMAAVCHLKNTENTWEAMGVPLVPFIVFEERNGKQKPVIQKALVKLNSKSFRAFSENREKWAYEDEYCYPLPLQQNVFEPPITLVLES